MAAEEPPVMQSYVTAIGQSTGIFLVSDSHQMTFR